MRGVDGADLGTVRDVYRVGENEVYVVAGGPVGSFDLPAVRAFIRIFAPRRGEIVVDADALDLRPSRSQEPDPDRPRAPRRRSRKRDVASPAGSPGQPPVPSDLPPAVVGPPGAAPDVPGESPPTVAEPPEAGRPDAAP